MKNPSFLSYGWRRFPSTVLALMVLAASPAVAQDNNEPGIMDPVLSAISGQEVRIPNTDQSVDGNVQNTIHGDIVLSEAPDEVSLMGHPITHVASPNDDMFLALQKMTAAAAAGNSAAMRAQAEELEDILLGTTEGRIYDGFAMFNYNRGAITADHMPGEYKMKLVRDTGDTFISPFDDQERKVWEVDINMLYYDGQIDSDTFLVRFPLAAHVDDTLRVNYRIYSLVEEDFSPTLVMLDKRMAANTVSFPFKGFDSVWVAFFPGQVLDVSVDYPPIRMIRGVYTWGWRVHPPRIQFMQPVYEIRNAHTGEIELDPQGISFADRNRNDLTLDTIADQAPEMKMYKVVQAVLDGASPATVEDWLTDPNTGPRGAWFEWADLAKEQRQLPPEAWDLLAAEGIAPGNFGDYDMVTVYMNNEMYGAGPAQSEISGWAQGDVFKVKLINFDKHTHYFRNVDFGTRLHDDILRCCGGGETSFEIMNFKPSYGAPKVAEMQWRAGWGFRPHYDVIQQSSVFSRGSDRVKVSPYTGGEGGTYFGYPYSEEAKGGDFRFNPPPFVIGENFANPASDVLRDSDGQPGLVIGQFTEGYGVGAVCPDDPYPGFCSENIAAYNPNGALNWPPPPARAPGEVATQLRFPPFLRNPSTGQPGAGDIIPPTGAWRPFLWTNPNNGTLFIDPDDPSQGHWADLTYSHGTPVFADDQIDASVELPRASGQVFYQFDDLFHDNSIFSPHPLFEGEDEADEMEFVRASTRGQSLRVRGRLSELSAGDFASWVTVFSGNAGPNGCTGTVLGTAPVKESNGHFVFRMADAGLAGGSPICAQSAVRGFAETAVSP